MAQPELHLFDDIHEEELITERDLIRRLNVSRTTIWRMRSEGLPSIKIGRSNRFVWDNVLEWLQTQENWLQSFDPDKPSIPGVDVGRSRQEGDHSSLLDCHWSLSVAFDPKHRPQMPHKPSSTVRREWWRFPQEAHLLDQRSSRYRRLTASELATLQGFPSDWGRRTDLDDLVLMRGYGDAVPPQMAEKIFSVIPQACGFTPRSTIEVCAGFGGLALGSSRALELEHLALIEWWEPACKVLRSEGTWNKENVIEADVCEIDWEGYRGKVDLISGGPPCQPWSKAGKGLGIDDDRDLLGYMPTLVGIVQPKIFIFENVPGLLSGSNEDYAKDLVRRLRDAGGKGSFAVALGVLNAADFGLPQVRRRVFIMGLRGGETADIHRFFDKVHSLRTNSDPRRVIPKGLRPWITFGDAIPDWGQGDHVWRRWPIPDIPTDDNQRENKADGGEERVTQPERPKRIQLTWRGRGYVPTWEDGGWRVTERPDNLENTGVAVPLLPLATDGKTTGSSPWYVTGDPSLVLESLRRTHGRLADLVYLDMPRLRTDAAAFDAADLAALRDTWLTVSDSILRRCVRTLSDEGVVAVLCGIDETPYVEILLSELLGPLNHVGTIAWQKGYSPRNMPNMRDLSPTHDNIVIYARRKETLKPVSLSVPAEGFKNSDGDPRGAWNAEQKGANKPDCDYAVNICPYRWAIIDGELPPGVWRINPKSGVIWGGEEEIKEVGTWKFTIEVTDKAGNKAKKNFKIEVSDDVPEPALADLPWLPADEGDTKQKKKKSKVNPLGIETSNLPKARIGSRYSACVIARGGQPWIGTTRPGKTSKKGKGRYWEFPFSTLLKRSALDAVDFKKKDDAIPALKSYLGSENTTYLNQTTTWLGRGRNEGDPLAAGYAQDAKKELTSLLEDGVVQEIVSTSKPAGLITRLVALFTRSDGLVLDIGSPAAEMASISTACGRRAIYVEFPSDSKFRESLLMPRLRHAAAGRHPLIESVMFSERPPDDDETGKGFFVDGLPLSPDDGSGLRVMEIGEPFATLDRNSGTCRLNYETYPAGTPDFLAALASIEGLIPVVVPKDEFFASSEDGRLRTAYVGSERFIDGVVMTKLIDLHDGHISSGGRLRIYYHRGLDDTQAAQDMRLELRRIPFSLTIAAGLS